MLHIMYYLDWDFIDSLLLYSSLTPTGSHTTVVPAQQGRIVQLQYEGGQHGTVSETTAPLWCVRFFMGEENLMGWAHPRLHHHLLLLL